MTFVMDRPGRLHRTVNSLRAPTSGASALAGDINLVDRVNLAPHIHEQMVMAITA
jgi:hypothetical protein